jgi:hypothetical protein
VVPGSGHQNEPVRVRQHMLHGIQALTPEAGAFQFQGLAAFEAEVQHDFFAANDRHGRDAYIYAFVVYGETVCALLRRGGFVYGEVGQRLQLGEDARQGRAGQLVDAAQGAVNAVTH